jgi:hypothetical protein
VRESGDGGGNGWLVAIAPGLFALVFEGFMWSLVAVTGSKAPVDVGAAALFVAVVAAVAVPIWMVAARRRYALVMAVVSLCVSFLGVFFGVLFLFGAAVDHCNGCLS